MSTRHSSPKGDQPKHSFTSHGAMPIKGHFNPALVRARSDEVETSDKFRPEGVREYCIDTVARDVSLMLAHLSREEQARLDEFAACINMGYEIGVDDDPFLSPNSKKSIERDVDSRRVAAEHAEYEEYMATQVIATFRRSPLESASRSTVTHTIPRFEMVSIFPTTQTGYDAFMPFSLQRRTEADTALRPDQDAGYTETPGLVRLAKDTAYGAKPPAADRQQRGKFPRTTFAERAQRAGIHCQITRLPPVGTFNPAATLKTARARKPRLQRAPSLELKPPSSSK